MGKVQGPSGSVQLHAQRTPPAGGPQNEQTLDGLHAGRRKGTPHADCMHGGALGSNLRDLES
eukprot:9488570-Alexandrium_andersonii.AAC.1